MGKASQHKRARRAAGYQATLKERYRSAVKANRRGRRVGSTLAEYEQLVPLGKDRLAGTLIARHTQRMDHLESLPASYRQIVLNSLVPVVAVDKLLARFGASRTRPPAAYVGKWVDHLAWGADSMVAAARLLLCGQVAGAAAIARSQLERWTMHRAFNGNVVRMSGEPTTTYMARAWSTPDRFDPNSLGTDTDDSWDTAVPDASATMFGEPHLDHSRVRLSNGREVCPALLYQCLSEIMHGRKFPLAIGWDGHGMIRADEPPAEVFDAVTAIADTISVCLRQIRTAVGSIAQDVGDEPTLKLLDAVQDVFSTAVPGVDQAATEADAIVPPPPPGTLVAPPLFCLMPLLPQEGLAPEPVSNLQGMARVFDAVQNGKRPAGRLFRDDEMVAYAFAWHRAAAARTALTTLESERKLLGDAFNLDSMSGRAAQWVLLTEATSLVGIWVRQPESAAAAALIGSALRSAYWLWLEDDDRAMTVLRCILEQCARLRVWRIKPIKAAALEQRATPRDWIEAAGWKRLRPLNQALGEFAHTTPTSRWSGARKLLADLQNDADPATAIYTARGASIDFVAALVARELVEQVTTLSPSLAEVLAELLDHVGLLTTTEAKSLEGLFNHIWTHRSTSLGKPDFTGPARRQELTTQGG